MVNDIMLIMVINRNSVMMEVGGIIDGKYAQKMEEKNVSKNEKSPYQKIRKEFQIKYNDK